MARQANYKALWNELRRDLLARRAHLVTSMVRAAEGGRSLVESCRQSDIETIDETRKRMTRMALTLWRKGYRRTGK